jgi:Icc-related predicted phosphoesterase
MRVTLVSDTHNKHKHVHNKGLGDLPGGDLIIHAGDISSRGYRHEIVEFAKWYNQLEYKHKVFIAGNHDWGFQNNVDEVMEHLAYYEGVTYLQDRMRTIRHEDSVINIYGTPWQPEFYNWAFNLPKNGPGLASKWESIPEDTDILVTHGPAFGILDTVERRRQDHLGCELLTERIAVVKPKIHVCGHIHSGYGYYFNGETHFFNASALNEDYMYAQKPFTFDWNPITNEINFDI